jgi:hypothetical protein
VLLAAAPSPIVVAGWGLAGPGRLADATTAALAMAGVSDVDLDLVVGPVPGEPRRGESGGGAPGGPGYAPGLAVIRAALALRRGDARRVLVTQTGDGAADGAIVLIRQESPDAT